MEATDSLLVDRCQAGDQDAFGQIVERYQNLVCSIAYSSTGNLGTSEELAQEAFVAAWKSIGSLRDSSRLRAWLCGIVRNLANNRLRRRDTDVLANAGALEKSSETAGSESDPVSESIEREEHELLDRTLASMPAKYREPLVLYYREQQSVSTVAEQLELSPNAVKQRLHRGRQMLRDEVAAIVERGLLRTAPGVAFTAGVLAALPVMSGTAKAATATITTAKGISAMGSAGMAGIAGAILGPLAGILGGWFGYAMSMKAARSERERDFIRDSTYKILGLILLFGVGLGAVLFFGRRIIAWNSSAFAFGIAGLTLGYVVVLAGITTWSTRRIHKIREETGTAEVPSQNAKEMPKWFQQTQLRREYESSWRFLGLPLLSVQFAGDEAAKKKAKPAVGWIAIGDAAYGLFALGGIAVGGVAFGGFSLGLISIGGLAIGGLAFGGGAIGWATCGGFGLGWITFSGIGIAWKAAIGGIAVSHEFALGGLCVAPHVNNEAAKAFVENTPFFGFAGLLMNPFGWWVLIAVLMSPLVLAYWLIQPVDVE